MRSGEDETKPGFVVAERSIRDTLIRFLALYFLVTTSIGVCAAYAFGPIGEKPYAERINFALRLGDSASGLPDRVSDGFQLRLKTID